MKVLGIVCSSRKEGNTETLVREALSGASEKGADTDIISFAGLNFGPCTGCGSCVKTGECVVDDDMKSVYLKLLSADGIIIGTPVYFWTVTAQAKLLMDRTYSLHHDKKLKGKICGCIAVAGRRGTANALAALNMFFLGQDMRPVSNGVSAYGSGKGDVKKDERGMRGARELGHMVAETIANQK
jgi:multimeric flavodoxin WrbA